MGELATDLLPERLRRLGWAALPDGGRALVAHDRRARLLGLAGLEDLPAGVALLLPRCASIHTIGMRFALDVEFLDRDGRLLRRVEGVEPDRVVWCRGAAAVVERRAGQREPGGPAALGGGGPVLRRPARRDARGGSRAPRAQAPR
jgi:uncharacterized membrane protein (UPF0127 family)